MFLLCGFLIIKTLTTLASEIDTGSYSLWNYKKKSLFSGGNDGKCYRMLIRFCSEHYICNLWVTEWRKIEISIPVVGRVRISQWGMRIIIFVFPQTLLNKSVCLAVSTCCHCFGYWRNVDLYSSMVLQFEIQCQLLTIEATTSTCFTGCYCVQL